MSLFSLKMSPLSLERNLFHQVLFRQGSNIDNPAWQCSSGTSFVSSSFEPYERLESAKREIPLKHTVSKKETYMQKKMQLLKWAVPLFTLLLVGGGAAFSGTLRPTNA